MPDILVVEADEAVRNSLASALVDAGYSTMGAESFADAVRRFDTAPPMLLIAAHRLGAYNGLHLLVRGRAERPDLQAIVVGPDDGAIAGETRALGAADYLPRRNVTAIVASVARLLDRGPAARRA